MHGCCGAALNGELDAWLRSAGLQCHPAGWTGVAKANSTLTFELETLSKERESLLSAESLDVRQYAAPIFSSPSPSPPIPSPSRTMSAQIRTYVSTAGAINGMAHRSTRSSQHSIGSSSIPTIIDSIHRHTVPSAHDVLVPETLLKKRKSDAKAREEKAAKAAETKKANLAKRKVIFKRAEQYTKEYRAAEREEIRLRRAAKAKGDFYVAGQPKVVFVVRLRGINNIAPKPRKILQLLRLLQINNGVFVRLTKATSQMLQLVQPYVTYGAPNLKTIRDLVYKRGYAKVNRQRLPINDNKVIEENLGKYGILSIEDIVHEIATCGPNFKAVTNFLWAFKLSNPNGGFKGKKLTHYTEGGNTGDRGEAINAIVRRMN
ncbi:hypothetical protein PaG_03845 [Moesziomyces aphidis]|uniref:60S ribosomal protein L7 n=1 Tax=Moesziomyces aphidis TaxID=84754 RepID=W3VJS9_MOEAP|nr:hypothetical protein PaG_03845 [Moesziomyces aphidis]